MQNSAGNKIIDHARALIDTPWHHQGRAPNLGIDCIGLVVIVALRVGYRIKLITLLDQVDYGRDPNDGALERALDVCFAVRHGEAAAGDLLLFEHPQTKRQHIGVKTNIGMIHSQAGQRVCEVPLDGRWQRILKAAYKWDS